MEAPAPSKRTVTLVPRLPRINPTISELTNTENLNKGFESSKSFEIDSTAFNFEQYFNLNFDDQCILIPGITGNQMIVFSLMQKGKIVEMAEADQLYLNPQSEYTKKLIAAIPAHAV
jgi:hypothetical protein